jgi:hypothetical protein
MKLIYNFKIKAILDRRVTKRKRTTDKVAVMIFLLKKRIWMNSYQLLLRDNQRLCLPSSLSSAEPVFAVNDVLE